MYTNKKRLMNPLFELGSNVPNLLSCIRLAIVPFLIIALLEQNYLLSFNLLLVAGITDLLDGFLARRFHIQSNFGAALDPVADKLVMIPTILILGYHALLPIWFVAILLVRDGIFLPGLLVARKSGGRHAGGVNRWGKIFSATAFVALLLVILHAELPHSVPDLAMNLVMAVCLFFAVISAILYTLTLPSRKGK